MPTLSLLVASNNIFITTCGAIDDKVGIMRILCLHWSSNVWYPLSFWFQNSVLGINSCGQTRIPRCSTTVSRTRPPYNSNAVRGIICASGRASPSIHATASLMVAWMRSLIRRKWSRESSHPMVSLYPDASVTERHGVLCQRQLDYFNSFRRIANEM